MNTITKLAGAMFLGAGALGLAGCATGLRTQVSRYQAMPAPQGQSFLVVPMNPNDSGGLEFSRYAELVGQRMQAQGYARAPSINQATMIVRVGYGVDDGHTEIVSDPFYGGYGFGGYGGYGGYGYGSGWGGWGDWGGWGSYGRRYGYGRGWSRRYYMGWNDPFWGAPYGGGSIRSYTYYVSELELDIRRKVDNASLFEGKAKARSRNDDLGRLVPSLVDAMFTGFPGRSGETIKITIPNDQQQARTGSY